MLPNPVQQHNHRKTPQNVLHLFPSSPSSLLTVGQPLPPLKAEERKRKESNKRGGKSQRGPLLFIEMNWPRFRTQERKTAAATCGKQIEGIIGLLETRTQGTEPEVATNLPD